MTRAAALTSRNPCGPMATTTNPVRGAKGEEYAILLTIPNGDSIFPESKYIRRIPSSGQRGRSRISPCRRHSDIRFDLGGTAEQFYNDGIRLSFEQYGVSGAEEYIADNVSRPQAYVDPSA